MKTYLTYLEIEGKECEPCLLSETEIFNKMDMSDCYNIEIKRIYLVEKGKVPIQCYFRGTWTTAGDPLRMEICHLITNELYSVGYGTDH